MVYYRCDGSVSTDIVGGLQCSSGWIQVSEPLYTLVPAGQTSALIEAVLVIVALIVCIKLVAKTIQIR